MRRDAFLLAATANACAASAGNVDIVYLDGFENGCGNLEYSEPFASADNSAWPTPWSVLGDVQTADIQLQAARLRPDATGYSLARMGATIPNGSVEARFTLRFEDLSTQGIGFYVRQNGGYLQQTPTHGKGYAAFIEGSFRGSPGIGLWSEIDGVEGQLAHAAAPVPPLANGVVYRVRLQVQQSSAAQTSLRAKLWDATAAEPATWQVAFVDSAGVLQNVTGGVAVDSWSSLTSAPISAYTFVDNIELISVCVP
jgi:hypothetical protein